MPILKDLCHLLYNACSPFARYSGVPHLYEQDALPTILLNFGHTRLFLPEFCVAIDLRPGKLVSFDATNIAHYTQKHPSYRRIGYRLMGSVVLFPVLDWQAHGRAAQNG